MKGSLILVATFILASFISGIESTNFIIRNNCPYTIWPAALDNPGVHSLVITGFSLGQGASSTFGVPSGWAGQIWARTFCTTDGSGRFTCPVGDCGTGQVSCNGYGWTPPASVVEIALNGNGGSQDFYDVRLTYGFNLPVTIAPGGGGCQSNSCPVDINAVCPSNLAVTAYGGVIGCRSDPQLFKDRCPQAYVNPNDVFNVCPSGQDYHITFCHPNDVLMIVTCMELSL